MSNNMMEPRIMQNTMEIMAPLEEGGYLANTDPDYNPNTGSTPAG
jgi:hypothetical protein